MSHNVQSDADTITRGVKMLISTKVAAGVVETTSGPKVVAVTKTVFVDRMRDYGDNSSWDWPQGKRTAQWKQERSKVGRGRRG